MARPKGSRNRPKVDLPGLPKQDQINTTDLQVGDQITYDVPIGSMLSRATSVFGRDTNPDSLSFDVYDRLRRDATIKASLTLIRAPILGNVKNASIDCVDPTIKAFVEEVILRSGLLYRVARTSMRAVEFGVAIHEKIWQVADLDIQVPRPDPQTGHEVPVSVFKGKKIIYKDIKEVNPVTVKEIKRRWTTEDGKPGDGSYDGFIQRTSNAPTGVAVPANKSFIYTHEAEFGNFWGRPRTREAYQYFWWKDLVQKLWMAWVEKKASPPRKALYPVGKSAKTGIDNAQTAVMTANMLDSATSVALPSTRDQKGQLLWDIQEMVVTDRTDVFTLTIRALDTAMMRAMFTPERVFTQEGATGSYALAQAHTDTFLMTLDALLMDFIDAFNRWVLRPLILVNFGVKVPPCSVVVNGLTDEERDFLRGVFSDLSKNPSNQATINFPAIATKFGVPIRDVQTEPGTSQNQQNQNQQNQQNPAQQPPAHSANAPASPGPATPTATRSQQPVPVRGGRQNGRSQPVTTRGRTAAQPPRQAAADDQIHKQLREAIQLEDPDMSWIDDLSAEQTRDLLDEVMAECRTILADARQPVVA